MSALLGIGLGLAFSAMSNLIVQAVPPSQTGVASGMNANIRTIGGAVGAAVMASVVTSTMLRDGYPAESGLHRGLRLPRGGHPRGHGRRRAASPDGRAPRHPGPHLAHAELAIVPGGTLAEG